MSKRAADGENAVQERSLNGLLRVILNEVGVTGMPTRYQVAIYDSI